MITFQHVTKRFGGQDVLDDVSFQINPGERIGIVGPNGAGKSTVFNMICGEMSPDKGEVITPTKLRIGYVHQQLNPHAVTTSLLEYVENAMPELSAIQAELDELDNKLKNGTAGDTPTALHRLGELQHEFEKLDGYRTRNRAETALSGLGFPVSDFSQPFRSFSGGWQSRAELARIIVADPDILLLDEPSNYLDIPAIEWLEEYLEGFRGTLLLISHDRFFLNSLTNVTLEIANSKAERYPGNYDYYAQERTQRMEQRLAAQKNQDRKREQLERFVERFRAKNTKATQVQSRLKQMEKMLEIDVPKRIVSPGKIRLRPPPHCGVEIIRLDDVGITYDGNRWVLRGLNLRITRGEKIALIGYNGLGKTTLLKMLTGSLPPTEGRRVLGHKVVIGYQAQDFAEVMDPHNSVIGTLKTAAPDASEQELRTMLGGFGFPGETIEKQVQVLSGGEKIRLAFARLLIRPPNCLILDEPTTHLDIQAREALETALQEYEGTLCLVSHDIDFVRHIATGIIAMTPPGITRYSGGYDYYREKTTDHGLQTTDRKQGTGDRGQGTGEEKTTDYGLQTTDKKEIRRQRALERQAMHEKTKDLKKAIKNAEAEVARLDAERADLMKQLAAPAENTNFASIGRRLTQVQHEIDIATTLWEQSTAALEKAIAS